MKITGGRWLNAIGFYCDPCRRRQLRNAATQRRELFCDEYVDRCFYAEYFCSACAKLQKDRESGGNSKI